MEYLESLRANLRKTAVGPGFMAGLKANFKNPLMLGMMGLSAVPAIQKVMDPPPKTKPPPQIKQRSMYSSPQRKQVGVTGGYANKPNVTYLPKA
jgi:hypothetical protein